MARAGPPLAHPPQLRSPARRAWLAGAAAASVGLWLGVEFLLLPRIGSASGAAAQAAEAMVRAHAVLWAEKARRGLLPADDSDPNRTGMIGPEYTAITTSLGSLPAKRTTATPSFAAAIARQLASLDPPPGALVVVVVSGSLVGGNIAAIAAVEALGLRPILISSVSASMWGATDPEFTWLDVEATLREAGVIDTRSSFAVLGGTGGIGGEIEPAGVGAIRAAAQRTGVPLVEADSLGELLDRLEGEIAAALEGEQPWLFMNVGGAVIGLGNCQESYAYPPGLNTGATGCTGGLPGLALRYASAEVPVFHVLNIRRLAIEWGLPFDPMPLPRAGAAL